MKRLGWNEEGLIQPRKRDHGKINAARRLRAETPVNLKWIANRLQMGGWTYVSNLLHDLGIRGD